jgi:hypothetical protein
VSATASWTCPVCRARGQIDPPYGADLHQLRELAAAEHGVIQPRCAGTPRLDEAPSRTRNASNTHRTAEDPPHGKAS